MICVCHMCSVSRLHTIFSCYVRAWYRQFNSLHCAIARCVVCATRVAHVVRVLLVCVSQLVV